MDKEKTLKERIKAVNELLKKEEPSNISTDHKGYSGYDPQSIIDSVNTEFIGDWSMVVDEKSSYPTKNKKGETVTNAFVKVTITLAGTSFTAMASHPILDDVGDAFKSAQTDALKKCLSYWSIGNRAYRGLLSNKK